MSSISQGTRWLVTLVAVVAVFWSGTALGQAPALLPVQGTLVRADGTPVSGEVSVTFALYADPGGTAQIWTETQDLQCDEGTFAAYLGSGTPVSLATFRDYSLVYLGVAVDGDAEMPLVQLASAPWAGYAAFCGDSATFGGKSVEQVFTDFETRIGPTSHARYTDEEAVAAMGALGDTNPLNHNRFSPSDAVAAMGGTADTNPLNHNRFAPSEAVAAMGALGDGNPLNHNRFTSSEAVAAMGGLADTNPLNHARYTNAEAVSAVAAADDYVSNTGDSLTGGLTVDNLTVTGSVVGTTATWGLTARTQGVLAFPEGLVYEDGAGNLTFTSTVIVMNPAAGSYQRLAAGTYALPTWGYLYTNLPPTGSRGSQTTPQVGSWVDTDRPFDGKDIFVLAQRRGGGEIYLNFAAPATVFHAPSSLLAMVGPGLSDQRLNSGVAAAGTWWDIPGRSVAVNKRFAGSRLKITYQDTLGTYGQYYDGCRWRILVDGNEVLRFSTADADKPGVYWHMENGSHTAWATAGVGAHTVSVQNMGNRGAWGAGTSECLSGWNTSGSFLSVEEVL